MGEGFFRQARDFFVRQGDFSQAGCRPARETDAVLAKKGLAQTGSNGCAYRFLNRPA